MTPQTPLPARMFDALIDAAPHAAFATLAAFAHIRNLGGIEAFLDCAEQVGLGVLGKNEKLFVHLQLKPDAPTAGEAKQWPLTMWLATALRPPEEGGVLSLGPLMNAGAWTFRHERIVHRLMDIMDKDPNREVLLTEFAFALSARVPCPHLMDEMLSRGVKITAVWDSTALASERQTLPRSALLWGNLPSATALIKALSQDQTELLISQISKDDLLTHESLPAAARSVEAKRVCQWLRAGKVDAVQDLLNAFDAAAGTHATARFRMYVMSVYLESSVLGRTPWEEDAIELLIGARGHEGLAASACARWLADQAVNQYDRLRSVHNLVRAHCAPAIAAFASSIRNLQGELSDPGHLGLHYSVDHLSMRLTSKEGVPNAVLLQRFRDTLVTMTAEGLTGALSRKNGGNLLHMLAEQMKQGDQCQKLPCLLELGYDPGAKDCRGYRPATVVTKGPMRDNWLLVEKSFTARAAAVLALSKSSTLQTP